MHNTPAHNDVQGPGNQAGRHRFESLTFGQNSDLGLVPSFGEETGSQQQGNSEVPGTLTYPPNTFCNPHRGEQEGIQSFSDNLSISPFRIFTIDDEEERRKTLGTYLDTRFPDIPDMFTNCQQHTANLDERLRASIREELESNSKSNAEGTLESRDPLKDATIPANDERDQEMQPHNLQIDSFMSRSISSDIFHQLGHMSGSSLNAFLDAEDKIEESVPKASRLRAGDILNGSTKLLDQLTPRMLKRPFTAIGDEGDQAMPDVGLTQLVDSPRAHIELLFGEAEEKRCDQEECSLNGMLAGGSSQTEAFENNKESQNVGFNPLKTYPLTRDFTNLQTGNQQMNVDSMKEIFRRASVLNSKTKQLRSRDENLKYYSLKRIQKDLNEHLDLSEQLYLTVVMLRKQRANLDEACRKEEEDIKRLREALQIQLTPTKKL